MKNQRWDLLVLRVFWMLAVNQPELCFLPEDVVAALLAGLDDAADCKIPGAPFT